MARPRQAPERPDNPRWTVSSVIALIVGAAVAAALVGVGVTLALRPTRPAVGQDAGTRAVSGGKTPRAGAGATVVNKACAPAHQPQQPYVGLATGRPSTASVDSFITETGVNPGIVELYIRFGTPFNEPQLCRLTKGGALPFIQFDPVTTPVSGIAAGDYDHYLTRYAKAVARFRLPIAIGFGHEMNGDWYPWGYHHATPAAFIAAWRRMHDTFTRAHATNVTWVWTINRYSSQQAVSPARWWWPGSAYVTWVGINGKYGTPTSSFASVFGHSLAKLRAFADKPVLLSEAGVTRSPAQPAQIRDMFHAITHTPRVIGMVWFNMLAGNGDWRLARNPAADAAFRGAAKAIVR